MPNTIIKASAGSGKTFQLSNQFLDIVLRAEGKTSATINSILASTFTRKAAGEILDRILTRLADAALDEKKQKELAKFVSLPGTSATKYLQKTTAEIAKNLYRLRVCTLDSFFNRIATTFALELGLPPDWSIIDDSEYQRSIHEAVREVFDESQKNEARKLLHLLQKGEQDRSVTQEVVGLAKDLLPLVRSTDADLWDHSDTNKLGTLTLGKMTEEAITAHLEPFENNIDALHQLLPKNKSGKPDGNCVNNFNSFMKFVGQRNWEEMLSTKIGSNFVIQNFVIREKPVESELVDIIFPIVQHARAVLIETIIHQTKATRDLLDLVWEKLDAILHQKRGFRFEDITFCLGEMFLRKPNVLPQKLLSHRMDAPTKHLLLDEFQDTSFSQWNILKPFVQSVDKTISQKDDQTSFFCVGDLKQAIYGWRGGIAEIFETVNDFLEKDGADSPDSPVMNETRRNSLPVIDTVSQVFRHIGTNAAVCEKSPAAAARWQEWFGSENHETLSPTKEQGYCVLEAVPTEDADENSEEDESIDTEKPFWKYTLNRIKQLHKRHPHRSIGVLFRAGKNIPTLLKGLKTRGIEASDEGGIPLTDSAAVQQVLSVMTLIDHPGDTIVRFHLASGPLADLLHLPDYTDNGAAERAALCWRTTLLTQGYGTTVKELVTALTPCEPKEMQRLEKLLELAYRFDEQSTGTRTRQFIDAVNAARMANPSADLVRVMTIHGAKGLEFDIVILPDLDTKLVGMPPKVIVSQESPTAPVNFVLRWVNQDLRTLLPPHYQEAFVQWQDNQVKESLAVLYVAMTRARYELVMIVPEKCRNGTGTYAGVLRSGLLDGRRQTADGSRLYQLGNENWDDEIAVEESVLPNVAWNVLASKPLLRNLPRVSPSSMEGAGGRRQAAGSGSRRQTADGSREPATVSPDGDRRDASLRGTAIHACFEKIKWLDDSLLAGTPFAGTSVDKTTWEKIVKQVLTSERNTLKATEIVGDFLSMSRQPEVRKVLSRSSYPAHEDIVVETERLFSIHLQDKILRGSMDRLVIRRLDNEVVGLDIIDFKTDRKGNETEEEFLEERKKNYEPQMKEYHQAAREMYPSVQNITTKLVFTSIDRVVVIE